jgi:hypothetical protein
MMKAVAIMQQYWSQVTGYLTACWDLPWAATVCQPLWSKVALSAIAAGALLILWAIWKVIDYKLKYRAAIKAEEQRQYIPPPEEMDKIKWRGDHNPLMPIEQADADMTAKIRDEIERKKLEEKGLLPIRK